ncbi:MAG: NAD(+)/NADH kinase [Verrucomicrobia bacterium]|nr:NAD(+)/NADH kinase [Verrucomicrobiota bacterium]
MKPIGIFANGSKPSASDVLGRFAETARRLGLRLAAEPEAARFLPGVRCLAPEKLIRAISLLMVFGGDGTMLRAMRLLRGKPIPVLGVNLGSLGFLTSVAQQDAGRALECVATGRYTVAGRALAECAVTRAGRIISRYRALNDVVIDRGACYRIVTLDMRLDGEAVSSFMCDGLIVSTPTGSTGHSLSAGGPIMHPGAAAFVVSLICPHTLSSRPLVIPDEKRITVRVAKSVGDLLLSVDGQVGEKLKPGDQVEIRRSKQKAHFVHLPDYSYFTVLRQELHWRGSTLA